MTPRDSFMITFKIQICYQIHQSKLIHLRSSKDPQKSSYQPISTQRGVGRSIGAKVQNKYHVKQPTNASHIEHREEQWVASKILKNPLNDHSQTREGAGRSTGEKVQKKDNVNNQLVRLR